MMLDFRKDRLLAMLVVDDSLGAELYGEAARGLAYLRGWILQNRATGEIWATWRFKRPDGQRNWYELHPKKGSIEAPEQLETRFRCGIEDVFNLAARRLNVRAEQTWHYPPSREMTEREILDWLMAEGLMEVVGVEPEPEPEGPSSADSGKGGQGPDQ